MEYKKDVSQWRMDVAHGTFLSIALKDYKLYIENTKKLECATATPGYEGLFQKSEIEDELNESFVRIIIFCALFMESYIYDYAARQLGDSYVLKYLDKLDIMSKWIVIPKLITNNENDRSRISFKGLKELIRLRNKIVHWKSTHGSQEKLLKDSKKQKYYNQIEPRDIFQSIKDIFEQLEAFDNDDYHLFHISRLTECEDLQ